MWWAKYIGLLFILSIASCPSEVTSYKLLPENISEWEGAEVFTATKSCQENASYVPDTTIANADILRRIRINIHFINTSDSSHNYNGKEGIQYAKDLVFYANDKLVHNKKMALPEGNNTPVYYPRYRYDLVEDGVFFHYDDELAYYVNEGKRNNYKRDVINKYRVGEDSILNVFYMIHHPDSIKSKTYSASAAGIALGKSVKLGTKYNPKDKPWKHASLLNHEIAHVLGLSHTWNVNDGCDDTPKNPNCWNSKPSGPCKAPVSNNLMDYNSNQHAITPCQIGKMRKNMAKLGSRQRDLIKRNWCYLHPDRNVDIYKDSHFTGGKDLRGHLRVHPGATLTVSCRLSLPEKGRIIVSPGARLVLLEGAHLHNDCNKEWEGIIIESEKELKGEVYKLGEIKIENVKGPLSEA